MRTIVIYYFSVPTGYLQIVTFLHSLSSLKIEISIQFNRLKTIRSRTVFQLVEFLLLFA